MRLHFLAPTPRFGKQNSRLPMGHQQRSPYYWYWAFLRRNEDYLACCERGGKGKMATLYRDFGDLREDSFYKFWTEKKRGEKLFAEQPLTVKFGELAAAKEWQKHWGADDVMVVAVPLTMSKRSLKGEFAKLLDSRHTGNKAGRPSLAKLKDVSTAKYKLERNYTIRHLQTALAVFDFWTDNQTKSVSKKLTLWEIGKELHINRTAIKDAQSEMLADRMVGRNVLAVTVSRYVKQAKAMIENAGRGKFPLF